MTSLAVSVILGVVAGTLALTLAVVVLVASSERRTNRLLALALTFEAVAVAGYVTSTVLPRPWNGPVLLVTPFFVTGFPFVYLALLSVLRTPLVNWVRSRGARVVLTVGGLLSSTLALLVIGRPAAAGLPASPASVTMTLIVYSGILLVGFYALAVAISAGERAPDGSAAQRKARAFLLSFGVRDALAVSGLVLMLLGGASGGEMIGTRAPLVALGENLARLGTILAMPLLAYGILRNQLFDIDLRVRWGITRGTVGAVFIVAYFVVAKLAESYLTRSGSWMVGAAVAGVLLFLTPRLNKMAERVAETTMPGVSATPAYIAFRKLEVYKAAVESALETGPISPRERQMLERLREKLGLSLADTAALEADIAAPAAGGAAAQPSPA